MRRRWATRNETGLCWVCGNACPESLGNRPREVCSEECAVDRKAAFDLLRARLRRRRCQLCQQRPTQGSKYCTQHTHLRTPCPRCGGKVRRNEGRGCHPTFCAVCRSGLPEDPTGTHPALASPGPGGRMSRRDWTAMDPEAADQSLCLICRQPLPEPTPGKGAPRVICADPRCRTDYKRLKAKLQELRRARLCRLCPTPVPHGERHCERHSTRRDPCVVCGQPAKRRVGRGDSRPRCPEHMGKGPTLRTRTQSTGEEST